MPKQNIIRKFKKNKGVFIVDNQLNSDAYLLKRMLKNNKISRLKKGVYLHHDYQTYDERVLIAQMYPKAVFCLFSAFNFYDLSTSLPVKHQIALNRNTKISLPPYPPIQAFYWGDKAYQLGITRVSINKQKITIYDLEKTVCDAIKHRGKIGEDITIEVIKNYINSSNRDLNKLMNYAKTLRIEKITEQYLKPLL